MKKTEISLDSSYNYCQKLAQSHYENFPVASILLPKKLRQPISVIYAFARTADDFADEGDLPQQQRLDQLETYSSALKAINNDRYDGDNLIFIALSDVIQQHQLPIQLFEDLLSAFKQDVVKNRYADFVQVLDYCTRSANPVGRLLLYLNGNPSNIELHQSDAVCTALQLINFYQDIVQDYIEQDRIYIPQDELSAAGLNESDLVQTNSQQIAPLIRSLYQRTQLIMSQGYELGAGLKGRLGWEVRAMTLGGISTLDKLKLQQNDALLTRPRLTKTTLSKILFSTLSTSHYLRRAKHLLNQSN